MSQSIELGQKQKTAQFLVTNDGTESSAIELTVKERKMDEAGQETLPDTKDIAVFPPQLIIPAKEKRTVRVNWVGGELKSERAFRVIAEQLPLKVDEKAKKNRTGIQMLMRYVAALYVVPEGAEPKLAVISHKAKGADLEIVIENSGNRHRVLIDPVIIINDTKKRTYEGDELKGVAGENVLAHSKRIFLIPGASPTGADATFTLKIND